jgi:hypothetical protein
MVIYHIDMVILGIDMGYGLMIWEMTISIWSFPISIWDILSLCLGEAEAAGDAQRGPARLVHGVAG